MPRLKDESTSGVANYMSYVSDAASLEAYNRQEPNPLLSAETLSENASLIDFAAFAQDYPDKIFPLLAKLRPEFQEIFIEYYLLKKPQSFIGQTHGCIQTRIWQALRIIERTIGAFIILGPEPDFTILHPILMRAGFEETAYGTLSHMITMYARTQSYAAVAAACIVPVPAIRKIFRPAIKALLASKDIKTIAVGAYLRNLTHQTSLTKTGISKRARARLWRMKVHKFVATPSSAAPLMSFGRTDALGDMPWFMFEISSEHRMTQIFPTLQAQGKRIFGKKAAQIFAPVDADGDLTFGYIFARSIPPKLARKLTRVRGIANLVSLFGDAGELVKAVTVPNEEIQTLLKKHNVVEPVVVRKGDFVKVLTGEAKGYCGTVIARNTVEISFPTGRKFIVAAGNTSVKLLPNIPTEKRNFWGVKPEASEGNGQP